MKETIDGITYDCLPGSYVSASEELLKDCADLYSENYGIWSERGVRPGENIVLSPEKVKEWFGGSNSYLYQARKDDLLIGYAIAIQSLTRGEENIAWVTQLVVHREYRNRGVAENILFSIWGFSDMYAWGIVSANPYAIRALEKATRRRAIPVEIRRHKDRLRRLGEKDVSYIDENTEIRITSKESVVNTSFFVDHSDTLEMIKNVVSEETPWTLGLIDEGWEWFAFTFREQPQFSLTADEITRMVETSESVVKNAYSKMNLDEGNQKWMKNTKSEVEYILERVDIKKDSTIVDFGCGTGRHIIELAKKGYKSIGVDYIESNIEDLKEKADQLDIKNIEFYVDDCRTFKSSKPVSLALCLYDVVGSLSSLEDNIEIVKNVYDNLAVGGIAVFSVMNYESTLANAKYRFVFNEDADPILDLVSSDIMETTGEVFDPEYYLVDTDTHLVYRREKFTIKSGLPKELVVRDRRFTMSEIETTMKNAGFKIVEKKYTNSTDWNMEYPPDSKKAKEILLIVQK